MLNNPAHREDEQFSYKTLHEEEDDKPATSVFSIQN